MKKCFFILVSVFLFSCSTNRHYFQIANGTWISKRKFDRIIKEVNKKSYENMSEDELKLLNDTGYSVRVIIQDTIK